MAEKRIQDTKISVSGHLESKRDIYQMCLTWKVGMQLRKRQSRSTGLKTKGNKKRAEALLHEAIREKMAELEAKVSNGFDGKSILFADYLDQFLQEIKDDVSLPTYAGYKMNIHRRIAPYFRECGVTLQELSPDDLNEFYEVQKKRVKVQTVHHYHAIISRALNYAVKKNIIDQSIIAMKKVTRPTIPKSQKFVGKALTQSEVIDLFDKIQGHKLELGVILGAYYGLRRSEIIGLRWQSIDFDANTITINHTVTSTTLDGKLIIVESDSTKSDAGYRALPLIPLFREKLICVKKEQAKYCELFGNSYNKRHLEYVYTDECGNRIKPNYLTVAFPKWMENNGFRRLRLHDLRHSCASLLLSSGVSLKQIQEWLGHSDFSITANMYAHLDASSKWSSADAMTWIYNTTLAKDLNVNNEQEDTIATLNRSSFKETIELIHKGVAHKIPLDIIKQIFDRFNYNLLDIQMYFDEHLSPQ